ncbi:MAG: S-layer homology domain-containing protein, partial [Oscillospiraceae bacterium]|nr:S-layer homology domain-containing protein [Oscillospiraceae bacterium]
MCFLKKCTAAVLALCLTASFAAVTAGAAFSDIGAETPNTEYVAILTKKGIVKGFDDGNFRPAEVCTRGQFLTFLWRASDAPAAKKYAEIKDIGGGEYYASAVYWAYENGLTKIYSDGTFKADAPVDREHAAYYLYKWAKLYGKSDVTKTMLMNQYTKDGTKISADSRAAFSWAMANGLLKAFEG